MAKNSNNSNTIDISLLFSANGTDNYADGIKQVTDALKSFNTIMDKTNNAMAEFKKMQKMMDSSIRSNATTLADIVEQFGGVNKYSKATKAQERALYAQFGGLEADIESKKISNARKSDPDFLKRQNAQDLYLGVLKNYFNNLEDSEKEDYMKDYYDYKKALFKRTQLKLQEQEQNFLKQPTDNSFSESVKYGLRRFEQEGRSKNGFAGFASRFLGNKAKGSVLGDAFALKDENGQKIAGTGINLGLAAIPIATASLVKFAKAIKDLGSAAMASYGEIEAVKTQLGVIYGSKGEAESIFNEIASYAVKSPFSVQSTAEYATLLKQSGVYSKDLMETLKMIGDVTGGNEEKMKRVANNYAQIQAATKASARDLREFAMAGIPIYEQIAQTLGKSVAEVKQMGTEGRISGEIIQQTFRNMTGQGGLFEGAIAEGAKTYKARKINAEDMRQLALAEIGERYFEPIASVLLGIKAGFYTLLKDGIKIKNAKTKLKESKQSIGSVEDEIISNPSKYKDFINSDYQRRMEAYFSAATNAYETTTSKSVQKIEDLKELQNKLSAARQFAEISGIDSDEIYKSFLSKKEYKKYLRFMSLQNSRTELTTGSYSSYFNNSYQPVESYADKVSEILAKEQEKLKKIESKFSENDLYAVYMQKSISSARTNNEIFEEINKKTTTLQFGTIVKNTVQGMADDVINAYKKTSEYQIKVENEKLNYFKQMRQQIATAASIKDPNGFVSYLATTKTPKEIFTTLTDYLSLESFSIDTSIVKTEGKELNKRLTQLSRNLESFAPLFKDDLIFSELQNSVNSAIETQNTKTVGKVSKQLDKLKEAYKNNEDLTNVIKLLTTFFEIIPDKTEEIKSVIAEYSPLTLREKFLTENLGLSETQITALRKQYDTIDYFGTAPLTQYTDFLLPKENIQNLAKSILSTNKSSFTDVSSLVSKTEKNNILGIAGIDWKGTEANLSRFALSLQSASEITETYKNNMETSYNKLNDILLKGMLLTPDSTEVVRDVYETIKSRPELFDDYLKANNISIDTFSTENLENDLKEDASLMQKFFKILYDEAEKFKTKMKEADKALETKNLLELIGYSGLTSKRDEKDQQAFEKANSYTVENSFGGFSKAYSMDRERINSSKGSAAFKGVFDIASYKDSIMQTLGKTGESFDKLFDSTTLLNMAKSTLDSSGISLYDQKKKEKESDINSQIVSINSLISKTGNEKEKESLELRKQKLEALLNEESLENQIAEDLKVQAEKETIAYATTLKNNQIIAGMASNIESAFSSAFVNGFNNSLKELGKSIVNVNKGLSTWAESGENIGKIWASVAEEMTASIGTGLVQAGIQFIANNPTWAGLGVGTALIAAGGLSSILSGVFAAENETESDNDSETDKLNALKDLLSELIDQAKTDAEYYQNNYLHKKALHENYSVNDAIITPRGDIISTHPDDYLIATKTPNTLGGGSSPNVSVTIINESGDKVKIAKTEKSTDQYGNVDIKAIIVATTAEAIADGTMDGAFSAMSARQNGYSVAY